MRITLLALAATVALTGCVTDERVQDGDRVVSTGAATDPDDPMRSGDCDDAFQAIVDADEPATSEIDMAVQICNSIDDWVGSAEEHPEALGDDDPMAVLEERCAAQTDATLPICEELERS
jgi:hypothetical protein